MKTGLIVPKGFGLVYVYNTNKGFRRAYHGAPRNARYDHHFDDDETQFILFGVFLYDIKKQSAREHAKIGRKYTVEHHENEFGDVGTPEGFGLQYETKYRNGEHVRTGKIMTVEYSQFSRTFIQRRRQHYQDKLKAINAKTKELMELGVERAAAIKAAKKCACTH